MNEHASTHRHGEKAYGRDVLQERRPGHRLLLIGMALAFALCSPLPSLAANGEPPGGEGAFRAAACLTDFTISCDDHSQAGIDSCHMRRQSAQGPAKDEGLAINVCVDGRITNTAVPSLEANVKIRATDFGEFVCGKDPDGFDFCLVCDTFKDSATSTGASHCVKIVNNEELPEPSTCGAYNISRDATGSCPSAELELEQFFSDPHIGFTIGINGSDAGDPAGGVGQGEGKDLLVCGNRSWQCIDDTNRSTELPLSAQQAQQSQTHALVDTPCCIRLSSGAYYCSSKLTVSATCK
jgi:hypothetical protein